MPTLPDSVEHAFNAIRVINTEEWLQEDIEAFQERWGGVDLLPFLQSNDPGVRWAAALSLGEMKDERARPVLIRMLGEFLPPPFTPLGEVGPDWFEVRHMHVAHLLGRWGAPALISVLRETLVRVWQVTGGGNIATMRAGWPRTAPAFSERTRRAMKRCSSSWPYTNARSGANDSATCCRCRWTCCVTETIQFRVLDEAAISSSGASGTSSRPGYQRQKVSRNSSLMT